ncbi:Ig-like domain-containing protein [Clostridiaceae bacterium HSG29]|nr:Ig-like domain-containing protein [Clostridiaceae bacterium HSG29]
MRKTIAIMLIFLMIFSYSTVIFAEPISSNGGVGIQIIPAPKEESPPEKTPVVEPPAIMIQGFASEEFNSEAIWKFAPGKSDLIVSSNEIYEGETVILETEGIEKKGSNTRNIGDGYQVKFKDKLGSNTTIWEFGVWDGSSKTYKLEVELVGEGKHQIKAFVEYDGKWEVITNTEHVDVIEAPEFDSENSSIKADPNKVEFGDETEAIVKIRDQYNNPMNGLKVEIYDDESYVGEASENGNTGNYKKTFIPDNGGINVISARIYEMVVGKTAIESPTYNELDFNKTDEVMVYNLAITVDDYHDVYLNGDEITDNYDGDWETVDLHWVTTAKKNTIAVKGLDKDNGNATISGFIASLDLGSSGRLETDDSWWYTLETPNNGWKNKKYTPPDEEEWFEAFDITSDNGEDGNWPDMPSGNAHWIWSPDYYDEPFDSPVWFRNILNPVAIDDNVSVREDSYKNINVLKNDKYYDDDTEVTIESNSIHGTVEVLDNRRIKYTPVENYYGPDEFKYKLDDGSEATVSIMVYNKTDFPVARDDEDETDEDVPVDIDVLANDGPDDTMSALMKDQPKTKMEIVSVTTPGHGTTKIVKYGEVASSAELSILDFGHDYIIYTPDPDWNGTDEFYYTMFNSIGKTYEAKVTVIVNPVDDPPVAVDDKARTQEETPVEIEVLNNDTDIDAGLMQVQSFEQPGHGSVARKSNDSNLEDFNILVYTPDDDYYNRYHGETPKDSFTYTLNGGSEATVEVKVLNIADQPIAVDDKATTNEETPVSIEVLLNDILPDLLPPEMAAKGHETPILEMHVESFTKPPHGEVERDLVDDDILVYTPDKNYYNKPSSEPRDEFTYTLNGGSTATVRVKVKNVADQPIANDDEANTLEDNPVDIDVLANDELSDDLSTILKADEPILSMEILSIADDPENGNAEIIKNGSVSASVILVPAFDHDYIVYTPNADFNGVDSFEYEITGGDTAIVIVNVEPVDDPPIAVKDNRQTDEETPIYIHVLNNDTDIDGGPMFVDTFSNPSHGTVERDLDDNDVLVYTPKSDYYNKPSSEPRDSFTYTLNGGSTATVRIKVNNVEDQPRANGDEAETLEDKTVVIDVLANDELPDLQSIETYNEPILSMQVTEIVSGPSHGIANIIMLQEVGSLGTLELQYNYIEYTPDPNWSGTDSFVYELNGGSTANVDVTVHPQIIEYNHRVFPEQIGSTNGYEIYYHLHNSFNELTLLAQMTEFDPSTVSNLRNDIVVDPYTESDIFNESFELEAQSFTTYAETISGVQSFDKINYLALEGTILRDKNGNIIGYADNAVVDNNDQMGALSISEWHTINYGGGIESPVVIAELSSTTGPNYTHVRVRNVTSNSFEVLLEEWDSHSYTNHHNHELISYLVIEEGVHELDDETRIEVIKKSDPANNEFGRHEFETEFADIPVVLSQTQTYNDGNQVWMRQKNITNNSVDLLKQTDSPSQCVSYPTYSEQNYEFTHCEEEIGIVAIEKIKQYTVTFDAVGGKDEPEDQVVDSGSTVDEPEDPEKDDWTFSHWKEVECDNGEYDEYEVETVLQDPFDFNTEIDHDTCLLAIYNKDTVKTKSYSPNAVNDSLTTDMNTPVSVSTSKLMSNDSHANNFESVQGAVNGTVKLSGNTVKFTPDTDFAGTAKFKYTIEYKGKYDTGTVTVEVNAVIIEEETPLGASNRYIIGYPAGDVRSFNPVTRAELATMYARLLSLNYQATTIPRYMDVYSTMWHASYINILKETGILVGKDDIFDPEGLITRAELASSIARYYEFVGETFEPIPSNLTDIEGHVAQSDIEIVVAQEMMGPYTGTSFLPDRLITRVETIKILNKLFDIQPRIPEKPTFNDMTTKSFGFEAIEAAAEDTIFTTK